MASETSELTFVRCPSCRSLVPASAARCRICNGTLEGTANASDGEAARGSGRVRQKTISASAAELLQAEDFGVEEHPPVATPANNVHSAPVSGDKGSGDNGEGEEVDPLAAFLQEFDEEPAPVVTAPPPSQALPADSSDDELDTFLDDFEHFDAAQQLDPEPVAPVVQAPPVQSVPLRAAPDSFDEYSDPFKDHSTSSDGEVSFESGYRPVKQAERSFVKPERESVPQPPPVARPQPSVEKRQPAPAPVAKQPQQQPQKPQPKQARPVDEDRAGRDVRPQPGAGGDRRDQRERDRGDNHKNDRRPEEPRKAGHAQAAHETERHSDRGGARPEVQASGPKTGKMRPGRLFGWLVSFESPDGRAIEIREGKFFVTGTNIRGTDLVIEDPSISTPHTLMSISSEKGLLIQDLMSERGVFVRSGERGQYRREDGLVELKHGDWVRFGDVEFLLTVVPKAN